MSGSSRGWSGSAAAARLLAAGKGITGKLPTGDAVTAVVTYPETVDLARVLAMPRWLIPAPIAVGDLQRLQREVRSFTGVGYEHEDSRYDPALPLVPEAS
jgi:hypothetical protein